MLRKKETLDIKLMLFLITKSISPKIQTFMKPDMTFQRIPARSPMKLFPTPGIKILLKLVAAAATARESAPPKVATVLVGKARQEALEVFNICI